MAKDRIQAMPTAERYDLLTGDPELIEELGGPASDTARGLITVKILELTGLSLKELGSLGHMVFYDKEDRAMQRKIISFFRRDAVEEIADRFVGSVAYDYPKLHPLFRHFYMSKAGASGITNYELDRTLVEALVSKKDLKDMRLSYEDIIAFQWNSDMTLCAILDISLLDPELTLSAEPLQIKNLKGDKKKKATRLAKFQVECTHSLIRKNPESDYPYKGYDPDEVEEYFARLNR